MWAQVARQVMKPPLLEALCKSELMLTKFVLTWLICSTGSYQTASGLDEDGLEDIDIEAMYNNIAEVFDLYHQDCALNNSN